MGAFRQLGDPVCPDCLCQHHEAAYAELGGTTTPATPGTLSDQIDDTATVVQVPITTTETCCVIVNAATLTSKYYPAANFEIERPLGTIRTQQGDEVLSDDIALLHHASWEVLAPGNYTYYLVNRAGAPRVVYASWIKAVASDCLG